MICSRCLRRAKTDKAAVLKFFTAQGITPQEISVGQIQVTDKLANEYGGNNHGGPRYIVQQTVTVQFERCGQDCEGGAEDGGAGAGGDCCGWRIWAGDPVRV